MLTRRFLAAAIFLLASASGPGIAGMAPDEPVAAPRSSSDSGAFKVSIGQRKVLLSTMSLDGVPYVSVKAMAAALGGTIKQGRHPGDLTLGLSGHRLLFSSDDPALVSLDSGAASISPAAKTLSGELYVPSEFITRVVSPLLEREPPSSGGTRDARKLDVKIVSGEGSLRLVFDRPRAAAYEMKDANGELLLRIDDPAAQPPYRSRSIGSPLLKSISFDPSPAGLTVHIGKGDDLGRATVFDLKDPNRIVVELEGRKNVPVGGAAVSDPPRASGRATLPGPIRPSSTAFSGTAATARRGLRTVVLDPGHGGEQKGAEGSAGLLEKDVTLDTAQRLQKMLQKAGIAVTLTRTSDSDLSLVDRTTVANREKADVFVSIHVNAAPRRDARGAETYYLAYQSVDQEAADLAAAENASAGGAAAGLGAGSAGLVLWDLAQAEHLRESSELAQIVQKELNEALGARDRGVKQAPFRVLMGATMPAVLVEVGFISNTSEESVLKSEEYRDKIASALARALLAFKAAFDRRQGAAPR